MCGIGGFFHIGEEVQASPVKRMADAMGHRGPDADGFYVEGSVSLCHRRLSIIDLSESSNQPFTDASGRFVIVFNGELYNFLDVRRDLEGYPFRTKGDTEVLLAAFAKWGPSAVQRFKGMFAFAIWDRREKYLFLCRDRMGVKPLYVYQDGKKLLFASEIRALLASGFVEPRLNRSALLDYFSFQSIGFPESAVQGVTQLEAGSWMKISASGIETRRYWEIGLGATCHDYTDENAVQQHIRMLLKDAVRRRLISDVPVGAFLSGGIDSSTVVGLMAEVSDQRPSTFNISFSEKEYDESAYAEIIAAKFNTRHQKIRLRPETFLEELENALNAMDTPSADGVNTYVVSKAIRNAGITVALSGVGGDELFAGYPFFMRYLHLRKFDRLFAMTSPIRTMIAAILEQSGSGKNQRKAAIIGSKHLGIEAVYPEFRRILHPAQISRLTNLDTQTMTMLQKDLEKRSSVFQSLPLLSQVSMAEYLGYTQHTLLKDTDQMSMAVSLEVREPFFDHELIEFMLQVPDHLKKPVYPKSLLVKSVEPLLPPEIVHRKKQGFLFPWAQWMRKELKGFCEQRLKSIADRDFIQGEALRKYWKRFLDGDPTVRWTELWLFVVLEYWMERNEIQD